MLKLSFKTKHHSLENKLLLENLNFSRSSSQHPKLIHHLIWPLSNTCQRASNDIKIVEISFIERIHRSQLRLVAIQLSCHAIGVNVLYDLLHYFSFFNAESFVRFL